MAAILDAIFNISISPMMPRWHHSVSMYGHIGEHIYAKTFCADYFLGCTQNLHLATRLIFLSFKSIFVSHIIRELCKLQFSKMTCIRRTSGGIVGYRLRLVALVLLYTPCFFLCLFCMSAMKICVAVFSGVIESILNRKRNTTLNLTLDFRLTTEHIFTLFTT